MTYLFGHVIPFLTNYRNKFRPNNTLFFAKVFFIKQFLLAELNLMSKQTGCI